MDDDQKLKLIFYTGVALFALVIIGIWENLVEPVIGFVINNIHISGVGELIAGLF